MSELTSTYKLLLSKATKEANYNRVPSIVDNDLPYTILGIDAKGKLVVGKFSQNEGIYIFFPVENPKYVTRYSSIAKNATNTEGVDADTPGASMSAPFLWCLLVFLIIISFLSPKNS